MSVNTGSNMTLFSVKKIVHLEDQVYDDWIELAENGIWQRHIMPSVMNF
jgi:hypothetical protein